MLVALKAHDPIKEVVPGNTVNDPVVQVGVCISSHLVDGNSLKALAS